MKTGTLTAGRIIRVQAPRKHRLRELIDSKKRYFVGKRIFDVSFSLLICIFVLSWLIPVVAIAILLETRGPVFFIQRRVGRGGKIFRCLKFRSMVVNKDANESQATKNDYRITRVGSFLRNSNLDEFPQFLNVLIGQMSVVGPRPHMLADCQRFTDVVGQYKFRNLVKPGITGLAQVKGFRGPAKDFYTIFRRFQYDCFYIRNAGFMLDIRIIYSTFVQTKSVLVQKLVRLTRIQSPIQEIRAVATNPINN